jgi:hypothetical protein
MLDSDLARYQEALRSHPSVRGVEAANGVLLIKAQTSNSWVLTAKQLAPGLLPIFHLQEPKTHIGQLAHVNHQGEICFVDREGISVDATQPVEVLLTALEQALAVLDLSLSQVNSGDLVELNDELEGYWQSIPGALTAPTHVDIDQLTTREIEVYVGEGWYAFADRQMKAPYGSFQLLKQQKALRKEKGLYIPLAGGIDLPGPGSRLTTVQVAAWIKQARDVPSLQRLLKAWPRRVNEVFIIFSQPRSDGSSSAVAVRMKGKTSHHPFIENPGSWAVTPLIVQRHAPQHVRARGGAIDLSAVHIAVVGAGSVGGHVTEQLAQAGVGKLTSVDPERLEADNCYRHVVGSGLCGVHKAVALQMCLQHRLPGAQVVPVINTLDGWLALADLSAVNGIVIAIGSPNIERAFNRVHWQMLKPGMPYVTTWLEPLGLGGHAQLTRAGEPGCLECLYTDTRGESQLHPKTAYTVPGQQLSRNLTGCGGAFTPYSGLDAIDTASLASRLILSAVQGWQTRSYATWRGLPHAAAAASIATTPWFTTADLDRAATEYSRVVCPVCGGHR